MKTPLHVTARFEPQLENLHFAYNILQALLAAGNITGDVADSIELALSEGTTNAIKSTPKTEVVEVELTLENKTLTVVIRDRGHGFDIENVDAPNLVEHHEGGYGVFIMHQVMDSVKYTRGKEYNELLLTKCVSQSCV